MNDQIMDELIAISEAGRKDVPKKFFVQRDHFEACLAEGAQPAPILYRAGGEENKWARIVTAIIQELRLLLCTDDVKYKDVRSRGEGFAKAALPGIAGYVAGAGGISQGVATACVAFIAISIFRIGIGAFCQLTEPHRKKSC